MSAEAANNRPSQTTGQRIRRAVIAFLFSILLTFLLLEGLLSLDPLGFVHFRDHLVLVNHTIPSIPGYTYAPGRYELARNRVTMLDDGTRLVPDTTPTAEKTLIFVGDSVTFGYGVDDEATFANLIARQHPDVHVYNTGITGYNSTNVLRQVQQYPDAEAIVYLITDNDDDGELVPSFGVQVPTHSWVAVYAINLPPLLFPDELRPVYDTERYLRDVEQIAADPRSLIVGYDDRLTPITPGAVRIAPYTTRNSSSDAHPNAKGHRMIAEQLLPLIRERFDF